MRYLVPTESDKPMLQKERCRGKDSNSYYDLIFGKIQHRVKHGVSLFFVVKECFRFLMQPLTKINLLLIRVI